MRGKGQSVLKRGWFPPSARFFKSVGGGEIVLTKLIEFWEGTEGQDVIEYTLLLAFICLAGVATFISMGSLTSGIWSIVNSRLAASNQSS